MFPCLCQLEFDQLLRTAARCEVLVITAAQLHPIDSKGAGNGIGSFFSVYSGIEVWNRTVPTGLVFTKIDF